MRGRGIGMMLGAAAGLLLAAFVAARTFHIEALASRLSSLSPAVTSRSGPAGTLQFPRGYGPLLLGYPVTLAEAESIAGVNLPRPNSFLAGDASVRKVFYEKSTNDQAMTSYTVAIDYEVGLILLISPVSKYGDILKDPGAAYQEAADGLNSALGTRVAIVETILGVPALVIDRSPSGVPAVDLVLPSGMRVQLIAEYAPDMDVSTVKAIAESIDY